MTQEINQSTFYKAHDHCEVQLIILLLTAKKMIKMAMRWLYVTTGGCAIATFFHYWKSECPSLEASTIESSPLYSKWNYNWDKREVSSLIKESKTKKHADRRHPSKVKKREENELKLTPTATRHIFLIRHGQYEIWQEKEEMMKLTPLGKKQASLVGQRLQGMKFKYARMVRSTMTRAIETSEEILKYLPEVPIESNDLLREGDPIPSEPPTGSWKEEYKYFKDGPRIEAAFRRYFHRAPPEQKDDSYEIIVCHANVIRYFICRLLQVPPEAWLRFSLHHCSITWTVIAPNGLVCLKSFGDSGFIPKDQLTRA